MEHLNNLILNINNSGKKYGFNISLSLKLDNNSNITIYNKENKLYSGCKSECNSYCKGIDFMLNNNYSYICKKHIEEAINYMFI